MASDLLRTVNRQLLELDRINGSIALSADVVRAISSSLVLYEGDKKSTSIVSELCTLHDLFLDCRPRMANVIFDMQDVIIYLLDNPSATVPEMQEILAGCIDKKRADLDAMAKVSEGKLSNDQTILLHSYSTNLVHVLERAADDGVRPTFVVAEQEEIKTGKLLKFLNRAGLKFKVVSEYSAGHMFNEIDLALFGALTVNHIFQVVMAPGSSGLISDLHRAAVPTYSILPTSKFSFWQEEIEPAHTELRKKSRYKIPYEKQVYSHDVVPLSLFAGNITELGFYDQEELMQLFGKLQREFYTREDRIKEIPR